MLTLIFCLYVDALTDVFVPVIKGSSSTPEQT